MERRKAKQNNTRDNEREREKGERYGKREGEREIHTNNVRGTMREIHPLAQRETQ